MIRWDMSRRAVSVTLDEANLTWLRGRARVTAGGNLSQTLDRLVTDARTGGQVKPVRSAVGLVTIPADDPDLSKAKAAIRELFEESLARPLLVRDAATAYGARARKARKASAGKRRE
jgi:hypothetical protein